MKPDQAPQKLPQLEFLIIGEQPFDRMSNARDLSHRTKIACKAGQDTDPLQHYPRNPWLTRLFTVTGIATPLPLQDSGVTGREGSKPSRNLTSLDRYRARSSLNPARSFVDFQFSMHSVFKNSDSHLASTGKLSLEDGNCAVPWRAKAMGHTESSSSYLSRSRFSP